MISRLPGFDPGNASPTSDFSTSVTVFDSLGKSHLINVYFKKIADDTSLIGANKPTTGNRWMWWAVTPSTDSVNGKDQVSGSGTLQFNSSGALVTAVPGYDEFNFSGGVLQNQQIGFDFGQNEKYDINSGGSGLSGTTQFGSDSTVLFLNQDGYTSGSLQSLSVGQDGTMTGTFTNGQTSEIAQVQLARFIASSQLMNIGSNLFSESSTSGVRSSGLPGQREGGRYSRTLLRAVMSILRANL